VLPLEVLAPGVLLRGSGQTERFARPAKAGHDRQKDRRGHMNDNDGKKTLVSGLPGARRAM